MVQGIDVVQESALDIPFRDGSFDIIFTSGVLIHIGPSDLAAVMRGIHRCTRRYIWGFEYYTDRHSEIPCRRRSELLWKGDFLRIYLEYLDDLKKVREERLPYLENDNIDSMFLVEKR
jgi:hypothetical protein